MLAWLARGGPGTASGLAAAGNVRPQSMAYTLTGLESQGLGTRDPDPNDGRQTLVSLAAKGRTVLEEERRRRDGWLAEAIRTRLTAKEQRQLLEAIPLLQRLAELEPTQPE